MTTHDDAPLVRSMWPVLADEIVAALREAGEVSLASQVDGLRVIQECGCGDDFCQSFYTRPPPATSHWLGHRNVMLDPPWQGYLILDVVHEVIMFVEVLYRTPRN